MNKIVNSLIKNINGKLLILLPVIIFLILAIYNLNYPGISIDEAGDGIITRYILKDYSLVHREKMMITNYYLILFNKIFPIMQMDYVGAVFSYLVYPFSLIFGMNVISLRITPIFFSALTILFIYSTFKLWFNKRTAFLTSLLTAVNLVFVQYSRVGLYREEIFIIFFFWAGLFLFVKYSETRNATFLYLSLFFWGLGFSAKIIFLWYALGITLACMLFRKKLNLFISLTSKQSIISALSFGLGAFFIILYNIKKPAITIKIIFQSLFNSPYKKVPGLYINNLAYLTNLKARIPHWIMLLKGDIQDRIDWGVIKSCPIERLSFIIFGLTLISFTGVLIFTLFSRDKQIRNKVLFFFTIFITVMALTPFTTSGFDPGHMVILLPFPQIVTALFLNYIWQRNRHKKIFLVAICSIFLIPIFLFNIWMNLFFSTEMVKNGGYRRWSTAIYELAEYLDKKNIQPIIFGVGLQENIAFITNERIIPIPYQKFSFEELTREYNCLSSRNKPFFCLLMNSEESIPHVYRFMRLVSQSGKKKELEKVFLNRVGEPVYWLYKIY